MDLHDLEIDVVKLTNVSIKSRYYLVLEHSGTVVKGDKFWAYEGQLFHLELTNPHVQAPV